MMSVRMILVVTVAVVVIAEALPAFNDIIDPDFEDLVNEPTHGDRHRRFTCDLLSVSTKIGSLNHAACAAHCLIMLKGYRGGRCIDGVCNCRS